MEEIHLWVVLGVMVFLIVTLYTEWLRPAISFFIAAVLLLVFKVVTPEEALQGFANEQLGVIVLLLILSKILEKTHFISQLFKGIFTTKSANGFMFRMMSLVGVSSAFLNNTPLVAMMMPHVYDWSERNQISPSKVLIPLSYASILGGCLTLIGTSTNLIVNGLAMQNGEESLGLFDFVWVGAAMLVLGLIYLLTVGKNLLPDKKNNIDNLMSSAQKFFVQGEVYPNSPIAGKTIEGAGLRNLKGLFAVELLRNEESIRPVTPDQKLEEGDTILFAGDPKQIAEIISPERGLALPKESQMKSREQHEIVEVVVAHSSRLVGKTVKASDFRGRYDGAIVAIRRNGEKLWGKIGEIVLREGDVLLVLTGQDFEVRTRNNPAFYVISKTAEIHNVPLSKAAFLSVGFLAAILLMAFNLVPLFISLAVLLIAALLTQLTTPSEIRRSIDFNLVFIIGAGLAIGKGMINSGAADLIATSASGLSDSVGILGVLAGIFLVTNVLAAFMTSKAAVALILPVALSLGHAMPEFPIAVFILIVAFGGAANFLTPIGYQTNLMVYGPGGYSFRDFFKIGFPLTLIYMIVCVLILGLQFDLF